MKKLAGFSLIELAVIVAIIAILVSMAVISIRNLGERPVFELDANEWQCTEHKTTTVMLPMRVGDVQTVRPSIITRCVRYEEIREDLR